MGITTRANGQPPPDVDLADVDLGSSKFWRHDDDFRDGAYATLRRELPVSFYAETNSKGKTVGPGFWALTTHKDVHFASRHPELFRSAPSVVIASQPPGIANYVESMINIDDPRHQRLRSIVSRAFTPKVLARTEEAIRDRARRLVAAMVAGHPDGAADFVSEVSGPLPLQVICDMMGIPEEDQQAIFDLTNVVMGFGDPELSPNPDVYARAVIAMGEYAESLAEQRRSSPGDDLTTSLVQADVDGERLTSAEIASFFILLATAGNETTRNAASHGLLALTHYPEQRQLWWSDFDAYRATAVEEIVRWASPVIYMRRTLSEDVELDGNRIAAGDKVVMWYSSANRDETKFADPWMFDVRRDPNPHVGYGGGGVHFCLGANLARREITLIFEELHRQTPGIAATEEPARLQSPFIRGIKRLPVAWTPR